MFDGIDARQIAPSGPVNPAFAGAGTAASPLRLHGALDGEAVRALRDPFVALAAAAAHDVILDMTDVGYLDGAGVGAIAFLFRQLAARRLGLRIVAASGQPLLTLQDLGLAKLLMAADHGRAGIGARHLPCLAEQRA